MVEVDPGSAEVEVGTEGADADDDPGAGVANAGDDADVAPVVDPSSPDRSTGTREDPVAAGEADGDACGADEGSVANGSDSCVDVSSIDCSPRAR
jgi:hypothetical protein